MERERAGENVRERERVREIKNAPMEKIMYERSF